MRMDMQRVSFILMLTIVLLEAKLNLWADFGFFSTFSQKAIISYLFPKDPRITRVRNPDEVKTQIKKVTTLDFVSAMRLPFNIFYPIKDTFKKIMCMLIRLF